MITAAGILLLSKTGRALFVKRGNGGDCPGTWCFPGGRVDGGENIKDAAIRETAEEAGYTKAVADNLITWTRSTSYRESTGALPTPAPGDIEQPVPDPNGLVPGQQIDFTTFLLKDVEEFTPTLDNNEVVAYAWAPVNEPPQPLHPGCDIAVARFNMDELGVANAMLSGELTSPQKYGGFTLFNIRITGTGVAFRGRKIGKKATAKDIKAKAAVDEKGFLIEREEEFPYRAQSIYLTPEFLERCNGLPVVLEHPVGTKINGDEFNRRTIGTVFKPYIRGEEVWAIAKIYDEDAIELMTENQLSTSPGVVWFDPTVNTEMSIDDKKFLVEGKPSLMDHIAVCHQGVWDKGGPPRGVETAELARKDSIDMDKVELEKILNEHKGNTDTAINRILGAVEGLASTVGKVTARMDADDEKKEKDAKDRARHDAEEMVYSDRKDGESDEDFKKRHDAEETAMCDAWKRAGDSEEDAKKKAADSRKDAEEKSEKDRKDAEEEEKKAEKDAKDAATGETVAGLQRQLAELREKFESRSPAIQPRDADPAAFAAHQERYDEVFPALGKKTPTPLSGESLLNYRRRALGELQSVSRQYKDVSLGVIANDEASFNAMDHAIVKEVGEIARTDASVPPGELREIKKQLPTGHKESSFLGNSADWLRDFAPAHQVAKIYQRNADGKRAS